MFFKNFAFKKRLKKLFRNNKTLMLAYDQGLEHGPKDFNLRNVNPEFVFEIAEKARFNALVVQPGVAEKYAKSYNVPIIVKVNGKTSLTGEVVSRQNCSVKRALKLNPVGIGFTIYPGSYYEGLMFSEFSKVVEEAHNFGLPVIVWSYPRNSSHSIDEKSTDIVAYAARIALELGADVVKLKYNGDFEGFKWVVRNAGKVRVVVAGGAKKSLHELFGMTEDVVKAGACGLTIGRNVWQHDEPLKVSYALKKIIFDGFSAEDVLKKF